jgi:hypothetical protein
LFTRFVNVLESRALRRFRLRSIKALSHVVSLLI